MALPAFSRASRSRDLTAWTRRLRLSVMTRFRLLPAHLPLVLSAGLACAQPAPQPKAPADRGAAETPADVRPRTPAATLDRLFERLAAAKTPEEASGIANLIQRRWARSGSDTADLLMSRAQEAMRQKRLELAIELLDRIVTLQPGWAEAWNQRANALFVAGDSIRALVDVGEALKREPRHYGAMMGLAAILRQQGDDKRAMVAYRQVLAVYPLMDKVKDIVESLRLEVDGRDA